MNIKSKLIGNEEERAVSPVIGVILMVAITVILAAVIAAFVLDMGDMNDTAPQADFGWDVEGEDQATATVTLTHESGEEIDANSLSINVPSDSDVDSSGVTTSFSGDVSASDTAEIEISVNSGNSGTYDQTIELVWESDGSSSTLAEYEADISVSNP